MLKLLDVPNRIDDIHDGGSPHAADESYIDYARPGEPGLQYVVWPAVDDEGRRIRVRIGVSGIDSYRINEELKTFKSLIEERANSALADGASEVTLYA